MPQTVHQLVIGRAFAHTIPCTLVTITEQLDRSHGLCRRRRRIPVISRTGAPGSEESNKILIAFIASKVSLESFSSLLPPSHHPLTITMAPQAIDTPTTTAAAASSGKSVGISRAAEPYPVNAPLFHTTLGNGTFGLKAGLARCLKGGVIMDVVNAEQARLAEAAGACAVMVSRIDLRLF